MADNKTDYLETAVLNHVLRGATGGTAFTQPAAIYVGLFTADPTESGSTANEVSTSGTGYARQSVTFGAPSSGVVANTNNVVFPRSLAAWGNVTHFALFDASTAGNMLYYGPLTSPVSVDSANKKVEFEIGALTVAEQ